MKNKYIKYIIPVVAFIAVLFIAISMQTTVPYNPIAINLGFAEIAWYAVFILTGIILAAYLSVQEFKKIGWDENILYDGILYAVPLSIIAARIYYVIFDPSPNYKNFIDVINISRGGLAIHGAVIATVIFMIFFAKKRKISFFAFADIVVIGFLIGQIVGRWGNFMNQELYGPAIQSEFIIKLLPNFILKQMEIDGVYRHPTFLYEGIWNFVGLVFLLITRRKKIFKIGDTLGLYLIWYGLGRGAIIEPLRMQGHPDDALRIFGLPVNVILSLGLFMLAGIAVLIINRKVLNQPYYVDLIVDKDD